MGGSSPLPQVSSRIYRIYFSSIIFKNGLTSKFLPISMILQDLAFGGSQNFA